jgi:fructose-1,6-bisphosphatase I
VAAGYVVYGSSNMLVYSTGDQVDGFTYDPGVGEFFLSHPNIKVPQRGGIYSINEGNYHSWDKRIQNWVDWIKTPTEDKKAYRLRYIGAMVADLHRTLLRGGVFVYPPDKKNASGKLRLLYEASPMAFLVEAAGGVASDGKNRILTIQPKALHQRTPVYMGSPDDVADVLQFANA